MIGLWGRRLIRAEMPEGNQIRYTHSVHDTRNKRVNWRNVDRNARRFSHAVLPKIRPNVAYNFLDIELSMINIT